MNGDQRTFVFSMMLLCIFLFGLMGACQYENREDNQTEKAKITSCLENGGEWRQEQINEDYSPVFVCVKPGLDKPK